MKDADGAPQESEVQVKPANRVALKTLKDRPMEVEVERFIIRT